MRSVDFLSALSALLLLSACPSAKTAPPPSVQGEEDGEEASLAGKKWAGTYSGVCEGELTLGVEEDGMTVRGRIEVEGDGEPLRLEFLGSVKDGGIQANVVGGPTFVPGIGGTVSGRIEGSTAAGELSITFPDGREEHGTWAVKLKG